MRQRIGFSIEDRGFYPVLSSFIANDPALHAYWRAGRDWAAVVHFQMPRHRGEAPGANRLVFGVSLVFTLVMMAGVFGDLLTRNPMSLPTGSVPVEIQNRAP